VPHYVAYYFACGAFINWTFSIGVEKQNSIHKPVFVFWFVSTLLFSYPSKLVELCCCRTFYHSFHLVFPTGIRLFASPAIPSDRAHASLFFINVMHFTVCSQKGFILLKIYLHHHAMLASSLL
jgi:hypothetical protein